MAVAEHQEVNPPVKKMEILAAAVVAVLFKDLGDQEPQAKAMLVAMEPLKAVLMVAVAVEVLER